MTRDYDAIVNENNAEGVWNGEERRQSHRRSGYDRRDMIRFEPDKQDRRSGHDRRDDQANGWESGTTI